MPFTEAERKAWHAERARQRRDRPAWPDQNPNVCIHCGNAFELSDGVVTDEVAICDVCNGE